MQYSIPLCNTLFPSLQVNKYFISQSSLSAEAESTQTSIDSLTYDSYTAGSAP